MAIEQEFFKSFNIPTKFYTTVNLGDLDNNYQEVSANTLQELFDDNAFWIDTYIEDIKDFHDWEEKYPPITPEIVLKLLEIIQKYLEKKHPMYEFSIMEFCTNKSITEQTLNTCIQLQPEIQDQVRALFNAM